MIVSCSLCGYWIYSVDYMRFAGFGLETETDVEFSSVFELKLGSV